MKKRKDCSPLDHVEDMDHPGHCLWCGRPMPPRDDPFTALAHAHAHAIGVLLRAVSYDAFLTLGPGKKGMVSGTLELRLGKTRVRHAIVEGLTIATVIIDLARKWSTA